jgi:hypothetical protein
MITQNIGSLLKMLEIFMKMLEEMRLEYDAGRLIDKGVYALGQARDILKGRVRGEKKDGCVIVRHHDQAEADRAGLD